MAQIFISYAREDEKRIQPLVSALEKEGWSVFWDQHIPSGKTWRSHIGKALNDARCIIVTWSQRSALSAWVHEEADEGKQRGILVPVLLDAVEPPAGFHDTPAVDLSRWDPAAESVDFGQLISNVREVLAANSVSTTDPPIAEPITVAPDAFDLSASVGTKPQPLLLPLALAGLVLAIVLGGYWIVHVRPSGAGSAGDFGVLFGNEKNIAAAQDDIRQAAGKGVSPTGLYLRKGYYAGIAVVDSQTLADKYLEIIKTFRPDAQIRSMQDWCPSQRRHDGFIECVENQ
ncbi:MAG: toll/interleukin-1 receptor domain-containing protein [Candidatus Thiothrix singaporensis]|uniref:Toll/interleukin-1 receptor domain-containing protein n=1 Tax=Candidatus Thiothrix singaporensis TaxID=2799669 RepID=A0A7L6APN7_9GAMM|nr:MAG: toll/interleukin-1 receptor domain-containing protein [Candidatus Thiothrix singaporensis]